MQARCLSAVRGAPFMTRPCVAHPKETAGGTFPDQSGTSIVTHSSLSQPNCVAHAYDRDDHRFVDAQNAPCSWWTGHFCGSAGTPSELGGLARTFGSNQPENHPVQMREGHGWLKGYSIQDLKELRTHCKRSCRTCPPRLLPDQLVVSFHYRLGDVYNGGAAGKFFSFKMLSPNWIVFALLLLQRVMPLDCGVFTVYTDGQASDPPLEAMVKMLKAHDLPVPRIMSNDAADARAAFEGLARSDVLVTGTSGFGRLAGAANPGIVIAAHFGSRQLLGKIPNVVEIDVTGMKMGWQSTRLRDKSGGFGRWQGTFNSAKDAAYLPAWEHHAQKLKRVFQDHIQTRRPELASLLTNRSKSSCGVAKSSGPSPS